MCDKRSPQEETAWKHEVKAWEGKPWRGKGHERIGPFGQVTLLDVDTDLTSA
jgi:hypothetical protein